MLLNSGPVAISESSAARSASRLMNPRDDIGVIRDHVLVDALPLYSMASVYSAVLTALRDGNFL